MVMFSTIPGNTLITKPIEDGKTDIATFIWLKKLTEPRLIEDWVRQYWAEPPTYNNGLKITDS